MSSTDASNDFEAIFRVHSADFYQSKIKFHVTLYNESNVYVCYIRDGRYLRLSVDQILVAKMIRPSKDQLDKVSLLFYHHVGITVRNHMSKTKLFSETN